MIRCKRSLVAAALMIGCASARAGAPQPFPDELILDVHDLRQMLRNMGIDFRFGYVSESATNAQGGNEQLWDYTDQLTFWTKLDLQKLLGWNHALLNIVVTDRNGRNLSADADLGSLQQVQELYGRNQTWRWTEFWYDQTYFNGVIDWKTGRMGEGDDFAAFSCEFMNLTFCGAQPGNLVGNYWYNWPVSQWGTRIKVNVQGFGYVQLGGFEVDPSYLLTKYAMDLGSPAGVTGALIPFEIGWLPTVGGLAGSYKVGGWYNTSTLPDVVEDTEGEPLAIAAGEPLMRHGAYGAYLSFVQRVTAPAGADSQRGLSVFLNATYADRRTSGLDNQIALGTLYTGPLVFRPADELGVAVGETHVNPRVADVERLQDIEGYGPVAVQTSEWVGEVFYNYHVAGWLDLRPNVQYVAQPGGVAGRTSDVIVGMRLSINL